MLTLCDPDRVRILPTGPGRVSRNRKIPRAGDLDQQSDEVLLIGCYRPSRPNAFTGRVTPGNAMRHFHPRPPTLAGNRGPGGRLLSANVDLVIGYALHLYAVNKAGRQK